MKIAAISGQLKSEINQKEVKNSVQNYQTKPALSRGLGYPKGFTPYFGARLFRTPENFYEQEFNKKGMPETLKKYLYSNFEVNSKKPPMQLNKEAFADLELCESIEDVKEMFPDEPLFQNLQTLQTIRPKQGYLRDLRMVDTKNNEVLSNGEDLTVYLLKKVYLEGKDIDEINYNFEKDMKPELKVENATKEGAYFLHTTLRSLGVYLPDKSYWASLQATRTDKEYVPYTYTLTKPRKKPVYTKPRVVKKLELSPEERQRRREMMINRWIEMSPAQRQKQLEKMKEGLENSIFCKYMGPIMLIATDRARFSDKLYHYFQEKAKNTEYPDDLENLTDKQTKAIRGFWAENTKLKKSFAYYIGATIREFESAAEKGDEAITELLSKADDIMRRNNIKNLKRKYSNPDYASKELLSLMLKDKEYLPESYKEKYKHYVLNNKRFKEEAMPAYVQVLLSTGKMNENVTNKEVQICRDIDDSFFVKYKRDSISAVVALASYARPCMERLASGIKDKTSLAPGLILGTISNKIYLDSIQMLTGTISNAKKICDKYGLAPYISEKKEKIDEVMKALTKGFSDEEIKEVTQNFMLYMAQIVQNGNYYKLNNPVVVERGKKYLPKVNKKIENNREERKTFSEFLRDYEGLIRYSNEMLKYHLIKNVDMEKAKMYSGIRDYLYEAIIDDYLIQYAAR